jgi:hypothetical protein
MLTTSATTTSTPTPINTRREICALVRRRIVEKITPLVS